MANCGDSLRSYCPPASRSLLPSDAHRVRGAATRLTMNISRPSCWNSISRPRNCSDSFTRCALARNFWAALTLTCGGGRSGGGGRQGEGRAGVLRGRTGSSQQHAQPEQQRVMRSAWKWLGDACRAQLRIDLRPRPPAPPPPRPPPTHTRPLHTW